MKRLLAPVCVLLVLAAAMPVAAQRKSADYTELYAGELSTINYFNSASEAEQIVSANTVDSLVEYDRYGIVQPSLRQGVENLRRTDWSGPSPSSRASSG